MPNAGMTLMGEQEIVAWNAVLIGKHEILAITCP